MSKAENFVTYAIKITGEDKQASAAMKCADNPNLSYKAWEYLAQFINIDKELELVPYSLIGANIAKNKITKDGEEGLGKALRNCYGKEGEDQAKTKLMRILSCQETIELCSVLHYYIPFIESKYPGKLSYSRLLQDIIYFNNKIKTRWAADFFRNSFIQGEKQDAAE